MDARRRVLPAVAKELAQVYGDKSYWISVHAHPPRYASPVEPKRAATKPVEPKRSASRQRGSIRRGGGRRSSKPTRGHIEPPVDEEEAAAQARAAEVIQLHAREHNRRRADAAIAIQGRVRGLQVRRARQRQVEHDAQEAVSAAHIQARVRGRQARVEAARRAFEHAEAEKAAARLRRDEERERRLRLRAVRDVRRERIKNGELIRPGPLSEVNVNEGLA